VSSGQLAPESIPAYGRLYQTPFAERVRHEAEIATMAVGNISSYADCNSVLAAGRADLCVLARAHLFDPYWTRHAAHQLNYSQVPWPPQYSVMERYMPHAEWSMRAKE
jgi:anthraniloyl-CoA monooxygenase